jgi:hypothetical protein
MADERTITRIRKLLALAGNNSNEHEVYAAMLKAQALLLNNGLEMQDITPEQKSRSRVVTEEHLEETKWVANWKVMVAAPIAKNMRCTLLKYPVAGGGRTLGLVGMADDVAVAREVIAFAWAAYESLSAAFMRGYRGGRATAVKNDYLLGFSRGLEERFAAQVKSMALVIVQDKEVGQYLGRMNVRSGSTMRMTTQGDANAYGQGYNDGKSLNPVRSQSRLTA